MSNTDAQNAASRSAKDETSAPDRDRTADRRDADAHRESHRDDGDGKRRESGGKGHGKRIGKALLALVLLVALSAAWWVWQPFGLLSGENGQQEAGGQSGPPPAIPVRVAEVERGSIAETVSAVGSFRAGQLVTLRFQAPGRVVRLNFEEGEEVGMGRILAELDHEAQSARVEEAEARAREASNQLQRGRELNREGYLAEAELEDRSARAQEARSAVDAAKAALRDRFVIAPFDGRVGTTDLEEGAVVAVGDRVTDLRGLQAIEVAFEVPADLRQRIDTGQEVEVHSDSLGDTMLTGRVTAIATQADETTRALELVAELDNPDPRIAPGAYAVADLVLEVRDDTLLVPSEALVLAGRSTYVYRIGDDGTVQRAPVEVGVRRQQRVEILEGLQAGERIVASGIQKVGEGQTVRPLGQSAQGGRGGAPEGPQSDSGSGGSGSGSSGSGGSGSGGG